MLGLGSMQSVRVRALIFPPLAGQTSRLQSRATVGAFPPSAKRAFGAARRFPPQAGEEFVRGFA